MEKNEIDKMQDVLEKHFRDEKTKWFHSSDVFNGKFGETFLTYSYMGGYKGTVLISIGGTEIDESPIKVCHTAEEIEKLINAIIF